MFEIKLSQTSSLPCGGTKLDLFRTKDSSSSSQPSKNSARGTLRVNSDNFCMFEFRGIGVKFSPFSSYLNSVVFNFRCDKLTICISGFVSVMDFCMASVLGTRRIFTFLR